MGSFNSTCAVSGLSLGCGDEVKVLLLNQNPYKETLVCSIHDLWVPRTFAIDGTYNDYGSFENESPEFLKNLWLKCLDLDLVEVGWGNNRCHDVPSRKGQSFQDLKDALGEGRVFISRKDCLDHELVFGRSPYLDEVRKVKDDPRVPTLQNISQLITENGFNLFGTSDGFLVDECEPGSVRVRRSSFGGSGELELDSLLSHVVSKYSAMITHGFGSYSHGAEMLIRPKPSKEYLSLGRNHEYENEKLSVSVAMIRKDVWDKLVSIGMEYNEPYSSQPVEDYFKTIRESWNRMSSRDLSFLSGRGTEIKNHIPYMVGIGTHWLMAQKETSANPISDQDLTALIGSLAELFYVERVLFQIRALWKPTYSTGPQFGDFRLHEKYFSEMASLSKKIADEDDEAQDF